MIKGLSSEHHSDLEKSGWSSQTIESSRIYSVPPNQIDKILGGGRNGVRSLMAIPYPGTDFNRYKLFPPSKLTQKDEKPRKYHQAPGSPALPDQPVGFESGAEIIRITDGEKKAGKGTQEGLNVAGLGGIWNFAAKDGQGNNILIEDLERTVGQKKRSSWSPTVTSSSRKGFAMPSAGSGSRR